MQNCRTEDGVSHTDLIVRHGCFNQLGLHEQYEELSCQGSTDDINKKCSVSQILHHHHAGHSREKRMNIVFLLKICILNIIYHYRFETYQ